MRHPICGLVLTAALMSCGRDTDDVLAPRRANLDVAPAGSVDTVPSRRSESDHSYSRLTDAGVWRAIAAKGGKALVGLKSPGRARGVYRGQVLVSDGERQSHRNSLLARHGIALQRESNTLPILQVQIADSGSL